MESMRDRATVIAYGMYCTVPISADASVLTTVMIVIIAADGPLQTATSDVRNVRENVQR